jgi:hypothetical protein
VIRFSEEVVVVDAFLENIQNKESVVSVGNFVFVPEGQSVPFGVGNLTGQQQVTWPEPLYDPLMSLLHRTIFEFGYMNTRRAIDFRSYDEWQETRRAIPGFAPRTSKYSRYADSAYNRGLIANLVELRHHSSPSLFSRDHNVWHDGFQGRLRNGLNSDPLFSFGSVAEKCGYAMPSSDGGPRWYKVSVNGDGTFTKGGYNYDSSYTNPKWEVLQLLDVVKFWIEQDGAFEWSGWSITDLEFDVTYDDRGLAVLEIIYEWEHFFSPYYGYYRRDVWKSRFVLAMIPNPGSVWSSPGVYPLTILVNWDYHAFNKGTERSSGTTYVDIPTTPGGFHLYGQTTNCLPIILSNPTQDRTEPPESVWRPRELLRLDKAHLSVALSYHDIYKSCFNSTVDAFRNYTDDLSFNLYEFSTDIPELLELVPDFALLFRALRDIKRGNLGGIVLLGDFLTSTYLKYQFGQLPDAQALLELNERGGVLVKAYEALSRKQLVTSYGKFTFSLPDDLVQHADSSLLTTRTKAVFRASDISFVRGLISLNRDGILPTLSDLWETIPFTFVVDWFANIGGRLDDLETYALLACMDIEMFQHSFEIVSHIEPDFLESQGYRSPDDSFSYRTYIRALSLRMPSLETGRFDFGAPQFDPNSSIVGSLLWQLAR